MDLLEVVVGEVAVGAEGDDHRVPHHALVQVALEGIDAGRHLAVARGIHEAVGEFRRQVVVRAERDGVADENHIVHAVDQWLLETCAHNHRLVGLGRGARVGHHRHRDQGP